MQWPLLDRCLLVLLILSCVHATHGVVLAQIYCVDSKCLQINEFQNANPTTKSFKYTIATCLPCHRTKGRCFDVDPPLPQACSPDDTLKQGIAVGSNTLLCDLVVDGTAEATDGTYGQSTDAGKAWICKPPPPGGG